MIIKEETGRNDRLARRNVTPAQLAHIVFRTTRLAEMRAFYIDLLGARVAFENSFCCFLRYDDEHHRVVLIQKDGLAPVQEHASGLEHYSFTYATLGEVLALYSAMRDKGIAPAWCINHGFTTSIYYRDPDGNLVETQFDNMGVSEADAFMAGEYFAANPIGVDFDPELLLERYRRGDPMEELIRFRSAPYPAGAPHIRIDNTPPYDWDGALL